MQNPVSYTDNTGEIGSMNAHNIDDRVHKRGGRGKRSVQGVSMQTAVARPPRITRRWIPALAVLLSAIAFAAIGISSGHSGKSADSPGPISAFAPASGEDQLAIEFVA